MLKEFKTSNSTINNSTNEVASQLSGLLLKLHELKQVT
jgi:hypothetical protein